MKFIPKKTFKTAQTMTIFSKFAYKEDQEVEDMWFIDDDHDAVLYYLEGDLYLIKDGIVGKVKGYLNTDEGHIEVDPVHTKHFTHCIQIMKERYEWYYNEEYTNVMKFIKIHKGDKNASLRAIYDDMHYPTIRDAKCPFHCEGCLVKHRCKYCDDIITHCQATGNDDRGHISYYCDIDCLNAHAKEIYKPVIIQRIFNIMKRDENNKKMHQSFQTQLQLQSKNKIIHLEHYKVDNKSSIPRDEMMIHLSRIKLQLKINTQELILLRSLINCDKTSYLPIFTEYQESIDESMFTATNDQMMLKLASSGKNKVKEYQLWAEVFLGIEQEE